MGKTTSYPELLMLSQDSSSFSPETKQESEDDVVFSRRLRGGSCETFQIETESEADSLPCSTSELDASFNSRESEGQLKDAAVVPEDTNMQADTRKYCGLSDFTLFRMQYLIVHTAIMLADGLQGTHLYVLYEGYGYSVSSLYSLGFVAGAFTSPFIGPIVDKIGRKKAAMLYCVLEMIINYLELFPIFAGLITSRIIGGITTNLLFSVFESWLVSEHRSRGFEEEKLEIILRDSTIVSNSAAILSGYLAHKLADHFGAVGPFQGAVGLTFFALVLVAGVWSENFGNGNCASELVSWKDNMVNAFNTIKNDSKISRIGLIQGLTEGSLQTFVFLWSPTLAAFAQSAHSDSIGIHTDKEPAYGLIFGSFMACGVLGGFSEPMVRKIVTKLTIPRDERKARSGEKCEEHGELQSIAVDYLCSFCYMTAAMLFLVPVFISKENPYAFTICTCAFLVYELLVGLYMPCEGVIRSLYMPNDSICSLMTMLRVVVNVAVALGVLSTNYIHFTSAFASLSAMMIVASIVQLSLVPQQDILKTLARLNPKTIASKVGEKLKAD